MPTSHPASPSEPAHSAQGGRAEPTPSTPGEPGAQDTRVARRDPTRRQVLLGCALTAAVAGLGLSGRRLLEPAEPDIALYSQGVALAGGDERVLLPADVDPTPLLIPGSRVLRDAPDAERLRAREQDFLTAGAPLLDGSPWASMGRDALADLHALSMDLPAPVAGWSARWRYVWPRDTAHAVVLLAQLGRAKEVVRALGFLASHQRTDGWFEARVRLDGTLPDDRPWQADGAGWFLWAIGAAVTHLPEHAERILTLVSPAAEAALRAVEADLDVHDGLPSASPDYWEVSEWRLTLATAAVLLAGLQKAADLGARLCPAAARAGVHAERLAGRIAEHFGPRGYQRYAHTSGRDAGLLFLLPPYVHGFEHLADLLPEAWEAMARPAGGVAPGERWKDKAISWTPQTAMFAQAWAATGRADRSARVLDWLGAHRTAMGALPEKVRSSGRPAAVAPLSWTGVLVLRTLGLLGGGQAR